MRIRHCGSTGLRLSELGLGAATWGRDTDALEAIDMLKLFLDAGGSFIEASGLAGNGMAVDVVAQGLAACGRHRVSLVWRGGVRPDGPGAWAASGGRGDMLRSLDDSLARLGTDYVDVWLGEPDPRVPLHETLEALETARRSGRAHYVGLSHAPTWPLVEALVRAELTAEAPLALVEDEFSLLSTGAAPTVGALAARGVGFLVHSPLAAGVLTGKYRHTTPPDSRAASSHLRASVDPYLGEASRGVVEAVVRAAEGLDRAPLDVALAWARDFPGVSCVVVGPRTVRQLDQILEADGPLPAPIRQVLDEVAGVGAAVV
ncbi:aldo/keto reductase [Actinomyces sp. B33]|uniref:aldo/keto reductase n=1 Tax=Actinomyces sp. B33 TaxID=2942131 RepID=UPI0023427FBC|nr:aldo/keto reductase [Actinomyces sp. B33]MDC4233360.1 aldo/keto reductase [Actinomyces sp. B33]